MAAVERKLPVFDTAGAIFVFAWRERRTILRLSWFPLLLASIAEYLAPDDATMIGVKLLTVATWAVIAVSLHRAILFGDRQPNTWLNIRFGKVEALFAIVPVIYLAVLATMSALGIPTEVHYKGNPAFVAMIVMAIAIFFLARFCLIFPIAVVERRIDFAQAWALSHGNAWRMIGLWIVVTIPPFTVLGTWQSVLESAVRNKWFADLFAPKGFEGSLFELAVVTYPFSIVIGALCVGILSFSYKALAGFPADAVLKPKA